MTDDHGKTIQVVEKILRKAKIAIDLIVSGMETDGRKQEILKHFQESSNFIKACLKEVDVTIAHLLVMIFLCKC